MTRIHSSTVAGSIVAGHVSLPIPSTRYGPHRVRLVGGVDRALGVGADDEHLRPALLQVAADAADRAARADGDDDRVELAAGLLPDLGAGRAVVRLRVGHVRVLVGLEAAGDLLGQPGGDGVVALGRVRLDGRRRDDHLGAVGPQHRDLLLAHLVGHHEDAAVALLRRRDREAGARVAGGGLDDRAARRSSPSRSAASIIADADPVLVRAARVQVLELREQLRRDAAADAVEPNDRRVADEVEDGRVLARHDVASLRHATWKPVSRVRRCLTAGSDVCDTCDLRSLVSSIVPSSPRRRRRLARLSLVLVALAAAAAAFVALPDPPKRLPERFSNEPAQLYDPSSVVKTLPAADRRADRPHARAIRRGRDGPDATSPPPTGWRPPRCAAG